MWESLKPDWSVIWIVWLGLKIDTLYVSQIKSKKQVSLVKSKLQSSLFKLKPQLSLIKSKIGSWIKLKTVTRETADADDGDSVG